MATRKRHLAKAISYRVSSSCLTALIGLYMTGSWSIGASIGFAEFFIKLGFYYFHERLWLRCPWGTKHGKL
jgi:uncharacterized membrane protein